MSQIKSIPPQKRQYERARREGRVPPLTQLIGAATRILILGFFGMIVWECWVIVRMLVLYGLHQGVKSMTLLVPALITMHWCLFPLVMAAMLALFIGVMLRGGRPVAMVQGMRGFEMPKQYFQNLPGHMKEFSLNIFVHGTLTLLTVITLILVLFVSYANVYHVYRPMAVMQGSLVLLGTYEILSLLLASSLGLWQAYRFRRSLYMTIQEYKDDLKANEGDLSLKQARKEQHREHRRQELLAAVEQASVVVIERQDF